MRVLRIHLKEKATLDAVPLFSFRYASFSGISRKTMQTQRALIEKFSLFAFSFRQIVSHGRQCKQ